MMIMREAVAMKKRETNMSLSKYQALLKCTLLTKLLNNSF
jgi:hypothetical protein